MNSRYSRWALYLVGIFILATHLFYYPKWQKHGTEATLSWDVSGYYMYLPALFIYQDIKSCAFKDKVVKKYGPTPDFQQAFKHEKSGNYIMKYSIGQAIAFSPAFFAAHIFASVSSKYPADGFSKPYQISISFWSLMICILGLYFLRKILLFYFEDIPVAWVLISIGIGTNYLNYTAIDGAQTHNFLFTYYALLLWSTIQFYRKPSYKLAAIIGVLVGICALTRPTEIISALIPILWGVKVWNKESLLDRFSFLMEHYKKAILTVSLTCLIGLIQLIYWKIVANDWLVYSYENQGFSWLKPHWHGGFLSYKAGWLVYSPVMIFSLIGFLFLFRQKSKLWSTCAIFSFLFIYIAFAWDIWWYGGSLGQRTMVQCYPILAFPLAAFYTYLGRIKKWILWLFAVLIAAMIYFNLWFTHQAHLGGILHVGQMTKAYFWKTLGKYDRDKNDLKLLDNEDEYLGNIVDPKVLINENFELLTSGQDCDIEIMDSGKSFCMTKDVQFSPKLESKLDGSYSWLRASAKFKIKNKEWNFWLGTQFICEFYTAEKKIKTNMIRVHRLLDHGNTKTLYFDAKIPAEAEYFNLFCWNANGSKSIRIDNITVEAFNPTR